MAINQMPHNLGAEAALLGCILIDEEIQSELLSSSAKRISIRNRTAKF